MVKVKELEWTSEPPYRVARPFSGLHYATEVIWPEGGKSFDYVLLSGPTIGSKRFAALSEAQAAAQTDFEARILSALSPSPAPDMREAVEALEWALNNCTESDHPHYPYKSGNQWVFPYLVDNAGGSGGGVGEAGFDTAFEAVAAARSLTGAKP